VKDNTEVDSSWRRSNLKVAHLHTDRRYHFLVCAAGLSRRLLSDILEYKSTNHQLEFIEVLFNKKYNHLTAKAISPAKR
jgi:hypothetical protein